MQKSATPISERQLIHIKIGDLKFDKTNPNKLTDEQMKALNKSMQRFGYLTPIVIDQNNLVADGEHRALVYKQHGLKEIPAFKVNLKTDAERRMLRQVMNKLRGEHDRELDANELVTIFQAGKLDDLTQLIAQDKEDLQRLMLRYHPGLEFVNAENEAEIDKLIDEELRRFVPDTNLGELYQLGRHRLICADASDKHSIERLLKHTKLDIVLTDPPYGVNIMKGETKPLGGKSNTVYRPIANDDKKERIDISFVFDYCPNVVTWGGNYFSEQLPPSPGWIVWDKQGGAKHTTFADCELAWTSYHMPARIITHVWDGFRRDSEHYNRRFHPAQKPVKLLVEILNLVQAGSNVFDPFLGSGPTLIACEQTDRNCFGIEIDPHYCDVIVKRWEMYTGKKAVKIS